jgi:hypothetical protein
VAADVIVQGNAQSAAMKGFRPLARYIFSNNIAMTAPVIVEHGEGQHWRVSFVMPAEATISALPEPEGEVRLRAAETEVCATLRFRGYITARKIRRMTRKLERLLKRYDIEALGPVRIARFDPPWKPGFARHNELVVPARV